MFGHAININWLWRGKAILLILLMLTLAPGNAALAFSTAREIAQSSKIDQEILSEQGAIHDPLLTAWVQRTAKRIWAHVRRTDVPYTAKILDSSEINAFTTGGGFIYIDEGVLDTVASDDELAGIIGHETGHDEHRHPITMQQRSELLSLIFGLASLVSPGLAALGSFAGEGMMAKASRTDEYQADMEGLHFLIASGYDPAAMVSLMRRLQALEGDTDAHMDRYLADHPGLPERIARMQHTLELTHASDDDALLRAALHDEETARYAVAQEYFMHLLAKHPRDRMMAFHLARIEAILGEPARARQAAIQAEQTNDLRLRAQVDRQIVQLQEDERLATSFGPVDLEARRAQLIAVEHDIQAKALKATGIREVARATIASVNAHLQQLSAKMPQNDPQSIDKPLARELNMLGRAINLALDQATTVIDESGTLEHGRNEGVWAESLSLNHQLAQSIANDEIAPEERAVLHWYPQMSEELEATNRDILAATKDADQALLSLHQGLNAIEQVFLEVEHGQHPAMLAAKEAIAPAAQSAERAYQEYNRARSRQLALRLTLLNITVFPDRRRGLEAALAQRLAQPPLLAADSHDAWSAGEYVAARILGADAGIAPSEILAQARATHRSIFDLPLIAHVDTQALEIFMGLVYLDYTDDAARREFATGMGASR